MALCPTLKSMQKPSVTFDATNPDHLKAFKMLCLGEKQSNRKIFKQHPTLRFNLEHPYEDVRTMLFHKVCEFHVPVE